jgi:hypothetical protein
MCSTNAKAETRPFAKKMIAAICRLRDARNMYHPYEPKRLVEEFEQNLGNILLETLSTNHLFQSSTIDITKLTEEIDKATPTIASRASGGGGYIRISKEASDQMVNQYRNELRAQLRRMEVTPWNLLTPHQGKELSNQWGLKPRIDFDQVFCTLPRFIRACPQCKRNDSPFKLDATEGDPIITFTRKISKNGKRIQIWLLTFQCQSCDGEPLHIMLRREGLKISITGRSLFEVVAVPRCIPESVTIYYRESIIARNAGKHLAATLYLRVLLEVHMRNVSKSVDRIRGDDLCRLYGRHLDPEFPKKFANLGECYEKLSAAIHKGEEDPENFAFCLNHTIKHFEQLKLLPALETKETATDTAPPKPRRKNTQQP